MKYGSVVIFDHTFDTQRSLTTDFKGNLISTSDVRSSGKDDADGFDCVVVLLGIVLFVSSC